MIIFESQTNFTLKHKLVLKRWLKNVISSFDFKVGDINFIFMSDDQLLEINIKYLNHSFFTDVITFDYVENRIISGDIFISIDRVEDNSKKYSVSFENELYRVMVHGVLHLLGFKDKNDDEIKTMRQMEDKFISDALIKDLKND